MKLIEICIVMVCMIVPLMWMGNYAKKIEEISNNSEQVSIDKKGDFLINNKSDKCAEFYRYDNIHVLTNILDKGYCVIINP